ncbi:hypothetical protein FNF31_01228 [Cafeteria roenbergensis]|uniref:Uncharacterized protein n=1 Tax=Cafeteria roenbergensis TaxID=33653 RepID=A0A5A8DN67_CAFRO|nr:hypothetical protein FNF31_01228 [Cafeteria roenbergensis]
MESTPGASARLGVPFRVTTLEGRYMAPHELPPGHHVAHSCAKVGLAAGGAFSASSFSGLRGRTVRGLPLGFDDVVEVALSSSPIPVVRSVYDDVTEFPITAYLNWAMMHLLGVYDLDLRGMVNKGGQPFLHHPASKVSQVRTFMAACARHESSFRHKGRFLRILPRASSLPVALAFTPFRAMETSYLTYGPSGGLRSVTSFFTDIEFEATPLFSGKDVNIAQVIGSVVARTQMEAMEAAGAIGANKKAYDIAIVDASSVSHLPTWTDFSDAMVKQHHADLAKPLSGSWHELNWAGDGCSSPPGASSVRPGYADNASAAVERVTRTAKLLGRPRAVHPAGSTAAILADTVSGPPAHRSAALQARKRAVPVTDHVLPPWAVDSRVVRRAPGELPPALTPDPCAPQRAHGSSQDEENDGAQAPPGAARSPAEASTSPAWSFGSDLAPQPLVVTGRTRLAVAAGNQGGTVGPVQPSSRSGVQPTLVLQPGQVAVLRARDELEMRFLPVIRQALPTPTGYRLRVPWVGRSYDITSDSVGEADVERDIVTWVQRVEAAIGSRVQEVPAEALPEAAEPPEALATSAAGAIGAAAGAAAAAPPDAAVASAGSGLMAAAGSSVVPGSSLPHRQGSDPREHAGDTGDSLGFPDSLSTGLALESSGPESVGSRSSFDEDMELLGLA